MSKKYIWIIESLDKDGIYGTFSTKGQALNAIEIFSKGYHKYDILTDLRKIKRREKKPQLVNIRYHKNERLVALYIRYYILNNGAGLCHLFREHFGKIMPPCDKNCHKCIAKMAPGTTVPCVSFRTDENESKKNS